MSISSYFVEPKGTGTESEMEKEPRWNGVPPVGKRPIPDRWKFIGLLLIVFTVKIIVWGIYRYFTGNVPPFTDRVVGYWTSLFAKPILQLGPVILLWWYMFKEKGFPFRFTKVNLFSSVVYGLLGAVLFYVIASIVYVGHMELFGYGSDFHVVSGWDGVGWALTIATMFSYMLGTGTSEELFSRGFLQDQAARRFSISNAIAFSAVLFAIGHLPISILMYRMSFMAIFWYMLVLVVMGIAFSLMYQWSRNIVFPIIIHGLWDWYLTMFAIRGSISSDFASNPEVNFGRVDFINTLITLAIFLPLLYVVYRVHWKRSGPGEEAGWEVKLRDIGIVKAIRERDWGNWPSHPWTFTIVVVGVFCIAMYPVAAIVGVDEEEKQTDRLMTDEEDLREEIEEFTISEVADLREMNADEYPLENNGNFVISVNITLKWEDEAPSQPNYVNRPDHFKVYLYSQSAGELALEEGDSGSIKTNWTASEGSELNETLTVVVELVEAGDQIPQGIYLGGPRGEDDTSNSYELVVEFRVMKLVRTEPESGNVRW